MKKYKKQIIIISFIILLALIIIIFNLINKDSVETKREENGSKLPYINVEGATADALNDYLETLYKDYTSDKKSKFNYKYEVYNNIISVLIDIDLYNKNNYIKKYMSFNMNKDGSYLTNEDLSEVFNYDILEVKEKVELKLKDYYNEENNLGYVKKDECDFNCYLKNVIGVEDIINDITLVIENEKLVAYVNLNINNSQYLKNLKISPYKIIIE